MSRKTKKQTTQIKLVLNDSIALDALVLNRLATLPASRKNAWLQSLLIKGFCEECAEIQALQEETVEGSRYIPSESPTSQASGHEKTSAPPKKARNESETVGPPTDQPVAMSSLKAVVG
jgi:hypothetical protein